MKRSNFIKVTQDFNCENCNCQVTGNGYTNHCPNCLYSKHVDQSIPGDRESACLGLMKPIEYFLKNDKVHIVHKCLVCGKISRNKASDIDNVDCLVNIN